MSDKQVPHLRILGKIDLSSSNDTIVTSLPYASPFKISSLKLSFFGQEPVTMDFGDIAHADGFGHRYFSLLIGRNGMGKSSLLREIVDFFVDVRKPNPRKYYKQVEIFSVTYVLGDNKYRIEKEQKGYLCYLNENLVDADQMEYPLIVASTMGMFDKFPVQNQNPNIRISRYDVPYYKYIGPRASNNMFTTKSNMMLQILTGLTTVGSRSQLRKIGELLGYIGYEAKITVKYQAKEDFDSLLQRKAMPEETIALLYSIKNEGMQTLKIQPKSNSLRQLRESHLNEVCRLRQEGFLTSFHCNFYKDGEEIDCNRLSSGEFNMLCMVISVALSAEKQHLLILLDEPEISQHPNWQIGIIRQLDKALMGYGCHFLIATHCHYLVSNLPLQRSNVIKIKERKDHTTEIEALPSETYGWSAEEVLLKTFEMASDRSVYLAEIVGKLMTRIGQNDIEYEKAKEQVEFLERVAQYLSDVDPMKAIIGTIVKEFSQDGQH